MFYKSQILFRIEVFIRYEKSYKINGIGFGAYCS